MENNTIKGFIIYPDYFMAASKYLSRDIASLRPDLQTVRIFMTSDVRNELLKYETQVRNRITEMALLRGLDWLTVNGWVDSAISLIKSDGAMYRYSIFNKDLIREIESKADQFSLEKQYAYGIALQAAYDNPLEYDEFMNRYFERIIMDGNLEANK